MDTLTFNNSKIVTAFLIASLSFFDAAAQKVKIAGIQAEYHLTQPLCFRIINESDSIQYYTVSLEKLDTNNNWFEVRTDIFSYSTNGISKAARLIKIIGDSTNKACVELAKLIHKANGAAYRLRVDIYYPLATVYTSFYSSKFNIYI